jgi:hypothetical protein
MSETHGNHCPKENITLSLHPTNTYMTVTEIAQKKAKERFCPAAILFQFNSHKKEENVKRISKK